MKLFDYQEVGANFLAGRRRALLLDAPGVGKTAQAIRGADRAGAADMQTVCPASVVTQWRKNANDIAEYDYPFAARSYESARDKGLPSEIGVLVLDELHYLKNSVSGRTVKILGRERYGLDGHIHNARYVWGMSGTFMPTSPLDLFPAMNAIIPGSLQLTNGHTMGEWQFIRKFCKYYDSGRGIVVTGGKNLTELGDRLAPYVLRRTKKQVQADWKEPVCAELWLDCGKVSDLLAEADLGEEGQRVADAFRIGGFEALQVLARTEQTGVSRYRRYVGMLKILPVVEWLLDQFDDGLEKIVVICVHREVIEGIQVELKKHDIESVVYYGGMSDANKEKAKERFVRAPECAAFIGQIVASGTGLDGLQHATGDMLFVEWSWVADDNYQALSRLDRIGQENPVLGRFAGLEGSLDGAIMASASRRAADNSSVFDQLTLNQ